MTAVCGNIPRVGEVLHRPRLFQMMDTPCPVVLVTGQAAQGKTTLVADYLSDRHQHGQWFHLNRAASDHGVLFDMIYRGVGRADPMEGANPPHITLGSPRDLLRQIEILVTAMGRGSVPLNLVLDDIEALEPSGTAFEFIETLLWEAPDNVRFFLLSRTLPGLNLSRFRMKKQLLAITNEDLAFTRAETVAFFESPEQVNQPGEKAIEKIWTATEGWAGGLVLVSESMRISSDLDQLPDRLSAEAFSYFSDEIYQNLTPQLKKFLMATSLFDELDTGILSQVFKDLDPVAVLTRLEQRNLFVRKIGHDPGRPVFKYNNLFREFLASDLLKTEHPDHIRDLNDRAGMVCWENRDHDRAVDFFMAAGRYDMVCRIIRIKGTHDLITGRSKRLKEWIGQLPKDLVENDPWMIFFATAARRIKGGKANITRFSKALELFKLRQDIKGSLLCLAYLIEAAVFIRQPPGKILKWIRQGEQALSAMGGKQRFTWARAQLWQQIGLGYITGNGDIPKGISACRNAILLARGIDNRDLLLNASVILTLGFVQSGDFSGAREMLDKIAAFSGEDKFPEYRALNNITNIDFALKRGDLDLAGTLLSQAEADIEKFGLIFLYPGFVEAKAIFFAARGQFDQALQTADHLSDFSILDGNAFYMGVAQRIKAVTFLFDGRYEPAADAAQAAVEALGKLVRNDIHLNLARQVQGISAYYLGRVEQARALLEQTIDYFMVIGSDLSFCETAFALGLLAQPDRAAARQWFAKGFEKAVENHYRYFPLFGTREMGRVFVGAALSGIDAPVLVPYFKQMKTPELASAIVRQINDCLDLAPAKERVQMADRLTDLYKAALPRVLIHTLGRFRLTMDGQDMDLGTFGGAKPLLLLKAMILKGGHDIPKEVLIDALWPQASEAAGEKNLKVNLHRLRKALEPSPVKAMGYFYISQKSGRVCLDPDLIRLDIQAFVHHINQGIRFAAQKDREAAIKAYDAAVALYRGDYFAEDLYLEWVGHHRDFYRLKCIDAMEKTARLNQELDRWQAAVDAWQGVLGLDSCSETAYCQLMTLYGDAGLKADVARLFDQCRTMLRLELDAAPEAATVRLMKKYTGQGS